MFEEIKKILVEEFSIEEDKITLGSEFVNDLGINSLELADLVFLCEDKFNVTFEEAKYMLVSCCAFVNYLIAEYGKIK